MNEHRVFVYGTLRSGNARSMSFRFPNSKFVAEAKVNGSLYDLGDFPGLLLDESNSLVLGEVYEVNDEILHELDEFEASSHYLRKQAEVSFGTHKAKCWIYEPDPKSYLLLKLIPSGDWIEYARKKHGESLP